MCRGWKEETHTKEMPNAQRNGDFVYDSAETFGFLALPSAWSYNTVYAMRFATLTQIARLRLATSHTPRTLGDIGFLKGANHG